MAGRLRKVIFPAAFICIGIIPCFAQEQAAPTTPPQSPGDNANRPFRNKEKGPETPRKIFESLPPEEQQRLRENFERWQKMTPEERKELREREALRRQKILKEIDEAIKQSGLQLDEQARAAYIARYTQERRIIEQRIQKEMEEKRRPLLQDLINRLKVEFQGRSTASPTPSTTATPSPAQ